MSSADRLEQMGRDRDKCCEFAAGENAATLTLRSDTVRTLDGALEVCGADLEQWKVERWLANKWDCGAKVERDGTEELAALELWQVKVWFRRKDNQQLGLERLLEEIRTTGVRAPRRKRRKEKKDDRPIALELCVMDPHVGLQCYTPQSDDVWDVDLAESIYLESIRRLIQLARPWGRPHHIVWPFGNDFLHSDNVFHTTTQGTGQPESISQHEACYRGERLAIRAAELMMRTAPVQAFQIPGNHDRWTSYLMGRVLNAYYSDNDRFQIDASPSPYKRWRWGVNLVGFEHGHSVNVSTLAALMANEWSQDWAATSWREWHLGDQHRKGKVMEQQGVSVEYLPSIVPANEWHRLKGYNHQKRGAVAFVWHHDKGQVAKLNVNLNSVGEWM